MTENPTPVPANITGITDPQQLQVYERRAAALRVAEIEEDPTRAAGRFDFSHLQAIHAYILQDVYPWAGQLRQPDEHTAAMGMDHCPPEHLPAMIDAAFTDLGAERPSSSDAEAALETTADNWSSLTFIHPFVDGNSRTQRVFFDQYLKDSGWTINWSAVDADAIHAARHTSFLTDDPSWLAAQLRPGITPNNTPEAQQAQGSLARTQDTRGQHRPQRIYQAMLEAAAAGTNGHQFHQQHTLTERPPTPAQVAAARARRGISRVSPLAPPPAPPTVTPRPRPATSSNRNRDTTRDR